MGKAVSITLFRNKITTNSKIIKKKKTVESESQVLHDADEYLQDFQSGVMPLPNVAEFCLKYGHDYNMMISKNSHGLLHGQMLLAFAGIEISWD